MVIVSDEQNDSPLQSEHLATPHIFFSSVPVPDHEIAKTPLPSAKKCIQFGKNTIGDTRI